MSGVTGSIHTGLQVENLDRSVEFYTELLGFSERTRRTVTDSYIGEIVGVPGGIIRQAFLDIPGSEHWLELLEYETPNRGRVDPNTINIGTAHLCLEVADLDTMYSRLNEQGVRFLSSPVSPTSGPNVGGRVIYLLDPDDIRIELIQKPASNLG